MADNVIILGAGASHAAGIPLMGELMDTMWQMARTGRWYGERLKAEDQNTLEEALLIRKELDGYHGRAALDIWNIEEVLSILSFNALAGGNDEKRRLKWMTKAIATVIEITCKVKHSGKLNKLPDVTTDKLYQGFWRALIDWSLANDREIPPILTFNYDLVLERSLLHTLQGTHYRGSVPFGYDAIKVDYGANAFPPVTLLSKPENWTTENDMHRGVPGSCLREKIDGSPEPKDCLDFRILKLHGSVNFPSTKAAATDRSDLRKLIDPLPDPLILPPVFNKATNTLGLDVWTNAMEILRSCKNLIVCGYSLPATDIYMQYFLKAALGPNQELNHIYVFDPALFESPESERGNALKERYASNFSAPMRRRIDFQPFTDGEPNKHSGTLAI